jgi:hypothetical protein
MTVTTPGPDRVRIFWDIGDTNESWDQAAVWAIEQFGLPGDRYVCEVNKDWMEYKFQEPRDATIFVLRWS